MARQQDESVLLYDGVSAPTIEVQEGTSATYYIGDLVKFDANGQIVIATNSCIAGIACMDKTGSAGSATDVQFMELIDYHALYLMCNSSTADQDEVGNPAGIDSWTPGSTAALGHTIATGAGEVFVLGIYPGDVGVSGGRNIIRFNANDITLIGA